VTVSYARLSPSHFPFLDFHQNWSGDKGTASSNHADAGWSLATAVRKEIYINSSWMNEMCHKSGPEPAIERQSHLAHIASNIRRVRSSLDPNFASGITSCSSALDVGVLPMSSCRYRQGSMPSNTCSTITNFPLRRSTC